MSPFHLKNNQALRALAYLPLAVTAVSKAAPVQPASIWQQQGVAWTFYHENILGTSMQVTLRAHDRREAERAETALLASIDRQNLILSAWNRESELSRWLATRGQATRVSPELLEVLALFDHWRVETQGALDASAETAARLWQKAAAEHRLPSSAEIEQAIAAMQQRHWQIDPQRGTATHLSDAPLALASFTKSTIAGHAADAALAAGATGAMLNLGGDIVVRGDISQVVDIANPLAHAENDAAIDRVLLRDRAIATSGSYRRGFRLISTAPQPEFSHILDPRTAQPTGHILSSSVIASDPATAGALATAFSVLSVEESQALAAKIEGADYLLIARNGERIASEGWQAYQMPSLRAVSYRAPAAPDAAWNQNYELDINLELARIDDFRYHRPYIAVWVEDQDHLPVRTIALWFGKMRYLNELRSWYRDDQRRSGANNMDLTRTVSSATRPPGRYTLKWDGKDDEGKLVKPGKYTICIEAAREHGSYQILHQEMDFNGKPQQATLPAGSELGATTLDYHKR